MVTDTPEALWVAELVREQLLAKTHDELPHSISCRVTEWEWPHIRCEIIVERDSQKGIVIGKGGEVLKAVGHRRARHAARRGLPRAPRQGGEALAGPRRDAQPPRVLSASGAGARPESDARAVTAVPHTVVGESGRTTPPTEGGSMTEATDNVEFLKSLYKAFANGDVPTVLAAFDDTIEWNEAEGNPYNPGHPFVGPAAVVEGVFARVMQRHRRLRDPSGAVPR